MEPGETFEHTATREVLEETGLTVHHLELFGLYSGASGYATYDNGDQVFSVQIIFRTTEFSGELTQEDEESHAHRFFSRQKLPPLHTHQERFILDWANDEPKPIIK